MIPLAVPVVLTALGYTTFKAFNFLLFDDSNSSKRIKNKKNQPVISKSNSKINNKIVSVNKNHEEDKKKIDKYLTLSAISTVANAGGVLFYPILLIPGTAIVTYLLSTDILKKAYRGVKYEKKMNMEFIDFVLVSGLLLKKYFFTVAFMDTLYYLSRKILYKTEHQTKNDIRNIFNNLSKTAWLVKDNIEIEVDITQLKINDIISVKSGETIPVDGTITSGVGLVDQHVLTGESKLIEKEAGDEVFAFTVLSRGSIKIRVEKSGNDTIAATINDTLNKTVDFKSTIQSKGEEIGEKSILPSVLLSALTLKIKSFKSGIAILNSYIGGDVRLFIPLGAFNYFKIAAAQGILVKDARALDFFKKADTFVFDKTGTLTIEEPEIIKIHSFASKSKKEIIKLAALTELRQSHPFAKAILAKAKKMKIVLPNNYDINYEAGLGVRAVGNKKIINVGSKKYMLLEKINFKNIPNKFYNILDLNNYVYVALNGNLVGIIEFDTTIRPEAKSIIKKLKKMKKQIYIISGDNEVITKSTAKKLGIEKYYFGVLPEQKAGIIDKLKSSGKIICYVGDGINDSIALKKSHVSISLKGASSIAVDTASIIFMDGTLKNFLPLFKLVERYNKNAFNALLIALVPGIANIGCVLFIGTGIFASVIIYYASLTGGMANAYYPILQEKSNNNT